MFEGEFDGVRVEGFDAVDNVEKWLDKGFFHIPSDLVVDRWDS
jgi:hypothetical protein